MTAPIRVLIADDSALARCLLRSIIEAQGDMQVVGEAADGLQALQLVQQLRPQVVTMDLQMPVMDGMQAIEEIMYTKAVPILVVSSVTDAASALQAVALGAIDVVAKPDIDSDEAAALVAKLRLIAGVSVITRMRPRLAPPSLHAPTHLQPPTAAATPTTPAAARLAHGPVFVLAASTGGPQALSLILPALAADFAAPVVVAQHISEGFAQGMVDWLASICRLPVRLARHGEALQCGVILIAPSEYDLHLAAPAHTLLKTRPPQSIYRPSCNALLESAAAVFGPRAVGIILSGMGSDGARGLAAIAAAGGRTLAQNEASSVLYGMNAVAIAQGSAQAVLDPLAIAEAMNALCTGNALCAHPATPRQP